MSPRPRKKRQRRRECERKDNERPNTHEICFAGADVMHHVVEQVDGEGQEDKYEGHEYTVCEQRDSRGCVVDFVVLLIWGWAAGHVGTVNFGLLTCFLWRVVSRCGRSICHGFLLCEIWVLVCRLRTSNAVVTVLVNSENTQAFLEAV